ncbi:hypothetical protein GCM10011503_21370 [Henriciella pelagia]|uniref:Uncharacterized protein n=1 Tax=Henriciella pelagia TaxID=1977912 RepID=A0ABQ1JRD9_9PROT|nr:hypothetical protein GCM10011503_21370 [Henriciella pelagia]
MTVTFLNQKGIAVKSLANIVPLLAAHSRRKADPAIRPQPAPFDLTQAVKAAAGTAKPLGLDRLRQIGHMPCAAANPVTIPVTFFNWRLPVA